nr:response regulator transcription factor [uncultured Holophaga sp.]
MTAGWLLLVEDEPAQRQLLAAYLGRADYGVLEAGSMAEAQAQLAVGRPDLAVVDLNLPDGDGLELALGLSQGGLPVIVVSARETDRLRGLEAGLDDFVVKPCNPRELVARASNILRRCRGQRVTGLCVFGPYRLDAERRLVLDAGGGVIALTRGEFDLLGELVLARGRVRTRSQLAEALNPEGGSGSWRSVDVLMSRLRQKLEADPHKPALLLTAPGYGYRLNA